MKLPYKKVLSFTILLCLLIWLVIYLRNNFEDFAQLRFADPATIVVLIILFIAGFFVVGVINKLLLKLFSVHLTHAEAFELSLVTGFYNLVTPFRGGAAVRAMYLKKKHEFPYTEFVVTLGSVYLLSFFATAILGLIGIYPLINKTQEALILGAVFFCLFIVILAIILFVPTLPLGKNAFLNKIVQVVNGWNKVRKEHVLVSQILILTIIQLLLASWMLQLQFAVFGVDISFAAATVLTAIANLSLIISLTPGNIGINEAVIVFSGVAIGITATHSLSATLLGRAIGLLVLFILGPIYSYKLLKRKRASK